MAQRNDQLGAMLRRVADLERRLTEAERLADLLIHAPHAAVVHVDGVIRWANPAAARLVDLPDRRLVIGRPVLDFVAPAARPAVARRIAELLRGGDAPDVDTYQLLGAGRIVNVASRAHRTTWDGRPAVHVVVWDVTERQAAADRLAWAATHDGLTGLLNRPTIGAHLASLLGAGPSRPSPGTGSVAAVLVDLDGFKEINDQLGHDVGDRVLANVAQRLADAAGDRPLGRWGGDEFLVVWRVAHRAEVAEVADRLVAAATAHPPLAGLGALRLGASVGAATAPPGSISAEELVARADWAMYEAKRRGGGWRQAADLPPTFPDVGPGSSGA